jgi:two-component system, cell cycle sensor histidine kinase and response regulator CckA
MGFEDSRLSGLKPEEAVRLLEQEIADTNQEVIALTLELEKRLEELRGVEERYRRLVENAPDIIFRYEIYPRRICAFVNPRITAITGYSPGDFDADPDLCFKIAHPEDRPVVEAIFSGRGAVPDVGISTVRWIHKDGSVVWIEQHHVLIRDQAGRLVAIECIARDITDRKNLEERLLQSQKMEAIGRLAGGIAHDFNNLLTIINGYSGQALDMLGKNDPLHDEIEEIYRAGERAATLTKQLLAFSRRQVLEPRVLSLNLIVGDMERLLRRVMGEDVELSTELEPKLDSILADPGQIEQVIMNLAVNARDAMPSGGRLLVETSNVELDETYAREHGPVRPGSYVMLVVSDTGFGMDRETQAHIFEPFFTTKRQGKGTGLGLSTVFGIVQQSGGNIYVYSEPDRGTTFKIYFPRVAAGPQSVERRPAKAAGGSETVLVVEDEAGVRKLIHSVLKQAGYLVLEAGNGREALLLIETHPGAIHLIITDIVMPEMSGKELADRLRTVRPEAKLLFISGYTASAVARDRALEPDAAFLQKPFTPGALVAKVREVLDARPKAA